MDRDIGGLLDAIHAKPARALTQLRMELARDLLLNSTDTSKQVARRTGYTSDAAFNRAFTRYHGRSPGQWRREHSAG
jgi:AraC-like DNA-binding protein